MKYANKNNTLILISLALIIVHGLFDNHFKVDTVTLGLLAFILIVPLLPYLTKIKFGDLEAEINNEAVRKIEDKIQDLPPSKNSRRQDYSNLIDLTLDNPTLALAGARIEIEKRIAALYLSADSDNSNNTVNTRYTHRPLGYQINELFNKNIIDSQLTAVLRDIIGVANQAIHGSSIEKENAEKIITFAITALEKLDEIMASRSISLEHTNDS